MYNGVDERIVDGGGLCYDCWDSLGVWGQDVGMPKKKKKRIRSFHKVDVGFPIVFLYSVTSQRGIMGQGLNRVCQLPQMRGSIQLCMFVDATLFVCKKEAEGYITTLGFTESHSRCISGSLGELRTCEKLLLPIVCHSLKVA